MNDTTIYHLYSNGPEPVNYSLYPVETGNDGENFVSKGFKKIALFSFAIGVLLLALFYAPSVWYNIQAGGTKTISNLILKTLKKSETVTVPVRKVDAYQPVVDSKLPLSPTLKIPAIGVNTTLNEASIADFESALRLGVWRVPDFGTPAERSKPTILAAHRYGYLVWTDLYRHLNSFYNLPKVKVGDTVEIDYGQRKYIYEIYKTETAQEISDYNADLILYTCETLNGQNRVFEYARLLEI